MKKILFLLILTILFSTANSYATNKEALILKTRSELAEAKTPIDSIRNLFDLWDLSLRKDQLSIGFQIFDVAERANKPDIQLDILRNISSITSNDSILNILIEKSKTIAPSENQRETLLFLKIKRTSSSARTMEESARQKKITDIISNHNYASLNKYDQIEGMFAICSLLSSHVQGDLLVGYLNDLERLMDEQDVESYALRNLFYTESANIFSATNNEEKAIEADRKLLDIIDDLEKEYKAKGRKYKNYDATRYVSYRRMLSNYEKLSLEEANDIYKKILQLAASNEDVKRSFETNYRAKIYYLIKNKHYAEAIPLIKNQLEIEKSFPNRRNLYEILIEAAKATGDQTTLAYAENQFKSIVEEAEKADAMTKYNDLKVRYQVNMLLSNNARLELERKNEQIKAAKSIMIFVIIGWVAFALALIIMLMLWIRNRKTINQISSFIHTLSTERSELKKLRYGDNSVRGRTSTRRLPIVEGDKSVEGMINFILNDALYISSIGQEEEDEFKEKVDITTFMQNSYDTIASQLRKNVAIDFKYPDEDFTIFTDKYCLQWLTDHILKVAVRLAPDGGKIGLECLRDENNAYIIYTHNGESLPDGKEELIFKNFISYQNLAKENNAALKFCRMIHFLIDTKLRSDRSIREGRLTLTIPLK